jgi:hypothetical protein
VVTRRAFCRSWREVVFPRAIPSFRPILVFGLILSLRLNMLFCLIVLFRHIPPTLRAFLPRYVRARRWQPDGS